jgi:hypothetical protein
MSMKPHVRPLKPCGFCGKIMERKRSKHGQLQCWLHYGRQKYCDRLCMSEAFAARPSRSIEWSCTHHRARRRCPKGPCAKCAKPDALDVHHKDGDHTNNVPSNLERICRSCHNREHSRKKYCAVCGLPQKGLGYCNKHLARFKKYGDPLLSRVNQYDKEPRRCAG